MSSYRSSGSKKGSYLGTTSTSKYSSGYTSSGSYSSKGTSSGVYSTNSTSSYSPGAARRTGSSTRDPVPSSLTAQRLMHKSSYGSVSRPTNSKRLSLDNSGISSKRRGAAVGSTYTASSDLSRYKSTAVPTRSHFDARRSSVSVASPSYSKSPSETSQVSRNTSYSNLLDKEKWKYEDLQNKEKQWQEEREKRQRERQRRKEERERAMASISNVDSSSSLNSDLEDKSFDQFAHELAQRTGGDVDPGIAPGVDDATAGGSGEVADGGKTAGGNKRNEAYEDDKSEEAEEEGGRTGGEGGRSTSGSAALIAEGESWEEELKRRREERRKRKEETRKRLEEEADLELKRAAKSGKGSRKAGGKAEKPKLERNVADDEWEKEREKRRLERERRREERREKLAKEEAELARQQEAKQEAESTTAAVGGCATDGSADDRLSPAKGVGKEPGAGDRASGDAMSARGEEEAASGGATEMADGSRDAAAVESLSGKGQKNTVADADATGAGGKKGRGHHRRRSSLSSKLKQRRKSWSRKPEESSTVADKEVVTGIAVTPGESTAKEEKQARRLSRRRSSLLGYMKGDEKRDGRKSPRKLSKSGGKRSPVPAKEEEEDVEHQRLLDEKAKMLEELGSVDGPAAEDRGSASHSPNPSEQAAADPRRDKLKKFGLMKSIGNVIMGKERGESKTPRDSRKPHGETKTPRDSRKPTKESAEKEKKRKSVAMPGSKKNIPQGGKGEKKEFVPPQTPRSGQMEAMSKEARIEAALMAWGSPADKAELQKGRRDRGRAGGSTQTGEAALLAPKNAKLAGLKTHLEPVRHFCSALLSELEAVEDAAGVVDEQPTLLFGSSVALMEHKLQSLLNDASQRAFYQTILFASRSVQAIERKALELEPQDEDCGVDEYLKVDSLSVDWSSVRELEVADSRGCRTYTCNARLANGECVFMRGIWPEEDMGNRTAQRAAQRLRHEARVLGMMRSFYVPMFFGVSYTSPHPFVATEWVVGFSLDVILAATEHGQGRAGKVRTSFIPWPMRWQLLSDIVVGVSVLHCNIPNAIAHGSFSAERVMVDSASCRAKITGLGDSVCVTPDSDRSSFDRQAGEDMVALAHVLIALACLRPFTGNVKNPSDVALHLSDDVPEDWRETVEKCLELQSISKVMKFLEKREHLVNRFVQQRAESKKLKEKMTNIGSEMAIQQKLLEVVERNTLQAEKEAKIQLDLRNAAQKEYDQVAGKVTSGKDKQVGLTAEEAELKTKLDEAQIRLKTLQKQVAGGIGSKEIKKLRKEMRAEIDSLEETKDEKMRELAKLRAKGRQVKCDVEALETETASLRRRVDKMNNTDSNFLTVGRSTRTRTTSADNVFGVDRGRSRTPDKSGDETREGCDSGDEDKSKEEEEEGSSEEEEEEEKDEEDMSPRSKRRLERERNKREREKRRKERQRELASNGAVSTWSRTATVNPVGGYESSSGYSSASTGTSRYTSKSTSLYRTHTTSNYTRSKYSKY